MEGVIYPSDPLVSLRKTIIFSPKDWSQDKSDAWIYGVVIGWDDEVLKELSIKFNWSQHHINRLKLLNNKFIKLQASQ